MKALLEYLDGKKSYIGIGLMVIYYIGSDLKWWPLNPIVLSILGGGTAAAFRAGIAKSGPSDEPTVTTETKTP